MWVYLVIQWVYLSACESNYLFVGSSVHTASSEAGLQQLCVVVQQVAAADLQELNTPQQNTAEKVSTELQLL